MESVTFALTSTADMKKDDRGALIVNQATAVIVATWLEYAASMFELVKDDPQSPLADYQYQFTIGRNELDGFIDKIQDARKSL